MDDFIGIVILIIIFAIGKIISKCKVDNYDISKLSIGKMAMDAGKSPSYIRQKMISGGYDKDSHWKR